MKHTKSQTYNFLITTLFVATILFSTLISTKSHAALWRMDDNFSIEYTVTSNKIRFTFQLQNNKNGWMSVAFHEFEFPADTIVAWYDTETNTPRCLDYYNPGIPTIANFPSPMQDTNPIMKIEGGNPSNNINNVQLVEATNENGIVSITCERNLVTNDIFDAQFRRGMQLNVYGAYNDSLGFNDTYNWQQPFRTAFGTTRWFIN